MININETPLRTSKNFKINNIGIDENIFPKKINEFNTLEVENNGKNILYSNIDNEKLDLNLEYGNGDILLNQVIKNANKKVRLEINSKTSENAKLVYKFDKDNNILVNYMEIVLNENVKANLTIMFEADEDINTFNNSIIKLFAKNNSKLDITIVNLTNSKSYNFISIENEIKENAIVNYTIVDLVGNMSVINYYSNVIGNNASNNLNSLYLGKDNNLIDINYIAHLRGEKSKVNIDVEGALKDKAKKHFKGTIDFKKGSKKAIGDENESCMLLSDEARSIALPMLLCSEEDVEGSHSTSAGKIDNKELFYILSRGFSLKEAQKLLVKAKFNSILESIKDETLKEKIVEKIDKRLD